MEKKAKTNGKKLNYYRIYDDQEELNYFKSTLSHKQVERYLNSYEKKHNKYFNPEFIEFLQKYDNKAEIIKVEDVSY
ncbi:MAG: hypothetical protein EHM47_14795 [Ignavibacteriales bacterium]|jgi:hypothetical protein|nr:MAG: hypothetical protein EHM47_14795 [Ignavibacteriales bacterium]